MGLESLTGGSVYIDSLVVTNPTASDNKSEGDDHIRGVKNVLKNTFPSVSGAVTATHTELNLLDGVTATTAELNILDGVTATTAELNILDGVTATTAELNILDGVTATTAELNILDGVTATTAELNILDGVTATTSEINLLDGLAQSVAGTTSSYIDLAGGYTLQVIYYTFAATGTTYSVSLAKAMTGISNYLGIGAVLEGTSAGGNVSLRTDASLTEIQMRCTATGPHYVALITW